MLLHTYVIICDIFTALITIYSWLYIQLIDVHTLSFIWVYGYYSVSLKSCAWYYINLY